LPPWTQSWNSAIEERELSQAALAVREPLAERHTRSREPDPVAQAALLREHHPARHTRQPRCDAHPRGQTGPVEPELRGSAPGEELGEQDLAPRRSLPGDVPRGVARLIGSQAGEIVGAYADRHRIAGLRVRVRSGKGSGVGA